MILRDGTDRAFEPFDRFAHVERDVDVPVPALVDRFEELRAEQLGRLRELVSDEDLDRVGRHPELGDVTMRQLLATWAFHDLDHVAQIYAALAGSHDAAVGPWKAYLGFCFGGIPRSRPSRFAYVSATAGDAMPGLWAGRLG